MKEQERRARSDAQTDAYKRDLKKPEVSPAPGSPVPHVTEHGPSTEPAQPEARE